MAVIEANAIRAQGVHMFAVGVEGTAAIRDISLQAISGPDLYPGAAITTADWTKVDVGDLSTALKGIATDLCDESVVVHRTVNGQPVSGFSFTSSAGGATVVTGADGVANFSWDVPGGVTTTITETPRAGFPLASVSCLLNGAPTGTRDGNSITVTVGPQDTIDCTFASVIDPGTPPGTNPGGNPGDDRSRRRRRRLRGPHGLDPLGVLDDRVRRHRLCLRQGRPPGQRQALPR